MKKMHNEIALLVKTNLDCITDLSSKSLTKSYIGGDYFLLIDVLRKSDDMEEEINKFEISYVN